MAGLGIPVYMGDERVLTLYDLWAGTVFLIAVAVGEWWLFQRLGTVSWETLHQAGQKPLHPYWRLTIRYLTPLMLGFILVGSFFTPAGGDWGKAFRTLFQTSQWPWSAEALPLALGQCLESEWAIGGGILLLLVLAMLITLALREQH
jgi:hypothetical protein